MDLGQDLCFGSGKEVGEVGFVVFDEEVGMAVLDGAAEFVTVLGDLKVG